MGHGRLWNLTEVGGVTLDLILPQKKNWVIDRKRFCQRRRYQFICIKILSVYKAVCPLSVYCCIDLKNQA